MASRIVRKVKRVKKDSSLNALKENTEAQMKLAAEIIENKMDSNANIAEFNVNQLIAELSENTKVPKGEIENIQRRLLQQANEILKVNAFANANQPVPDPRVVNATQKFGAYSYLQNNILEPRDASSLGPQLVPEKLDMSETCGMTNGLGIARVAANVQGRAFFYGTGSATARLAASARAAPTRGECLSVFEFKTLYLKPSV